MKILGTNVILMLLFLSACNGQNKDMENTKHKFTNALIKETSPYLLQHAHNPVEWHAWNDATLQKAKDENKLILISIGYAACHWCHVMEHESFEDENVAKFMNENFICIKVDREERPDVDQIYITAAQLINGNAGWPLNAFALPNGKPFWAATYLPKKNWLEAMQYFVELREKDEVVINKQAQQLTEGIRLTETVSFSTEQQIGTLEDVKPRVKTWTEQIDFEKGGGKTAPKFPMPSSWMYLMQYHFMTQDTKALQAVTTTLDNMALGGIYDQIGGGFARYATDENWKIPHFEKMLYDNAQLVSLYSKAYRLTKKPLYERIVRQTIAFVEEELSNHKGGYYSSLDADSDGEEGKYYVWTAKEIEEGLGAEAPLFMAYYNINKKGNWEHGKNILFQKVDKKNSLNKFKLSKKEIEQSINESAKKLLQLRAKRTKPGLDDKIITAWNGLMTTAYCDAYRSFGDETFKQRAIQSANFILENQYKKDGELLRNYKNGKVSIHGLLDDYAFTIQALTALYQISFDEKWLKHAKELNDYTIKHFFDSKTGMFYYSHEQYSNLIVRKMEIMDNVIPSSNSQMAYNLFTLGNYFPRQSYNKKAKQMVQNVQEDVHKYLKYYPNWSSLELQLIGSTKQVAIVGKKADEKRKILQVSYLPNTIYTGGSRPGSLALLEGKLVKGETMIYVCENGSCKQPTKDIQVALEQIKTP